MRRIIIIALAFAISSLTSCNNMEKTTKSPSGNLSIKFNLTKTGEAAYQLTYNNSIVIKESTLGMDFRDAKPLAGDLKIISSSEKEYNNTWEMLWGEQREVENHYNELIVKLEETKSPQRKFNLIFRVYDDGIGFRYEFPEQENLECVIIMDENTQFNLTDDHKCWWIPGDWDIYEHLYNTTKFSEIDAIAKRDHPNLGQTTIPFNAVNTPITMKTKDGVYISFHEANLTDYSGMTLLINKDSMRMQSELVGSIDKSKVKRELPFKTPWRTIQLAKKAGDLIKSNLIVNLNEPNKLNDVSYIEPMKYMGIWWEMHLGKASWDYGMSQENDTWIDKGNAHGRHGATTENAKYYIDFAAKHDIKGLLIEGWNTGWEHWVGFEEREGVFDFVTPYPDYDLKEVVRYGKEKGVGIIMHHETSAAPRTYDQQLDTAYALMKKLGIHAVKTGYVGNIIPKGEYHHGQWMVNHYRKVLLKAAESKVMMDAHEPIKATGLRRTYPNMMSREGLRGQEFNAWSDDMNPPEHLTIVPFTRMLAGPIDFTPGIFDIKFNKYNKVNQVNTTIAKQLALYVIINSPLQMAADLPENYEGNPAFQFIDDVAVNWEKTEILNAEIGEYITTVRQARGKDEWFLGSITNKDKRKHNINLDFLTAGKKYTATIYADAKDAHWNNNPTAYTIEKKIVTDKDSITLTLANGGGVAISFIPVK
ncbi:MAG: glycoside hydrolase family 97 protein [Bacteroidota bacterium]|nr:glycoside hydrolase family 97 protein [Bacteroidota bacterium]